VIAWVKTCDHFCQPTHVVLEKHREMDTVVVRDTAQNWCPASSATYPILKQQLELWHRHRPIFNVTNISSSSHKYTHTPRNIEQQNENLIYTNGNKTRYKKKTAMHICFATKVSVEKNRSTQEHTKKHCIAAD